MMVATALTPKEVLDRVKELKMTKVETNFYTCELGRFVKQSSRVGRATMNDGRNCRVRNLTEAKIMLVCMECGGTDNEILQRFQNALELKKGRK
jgi:hypothetical protein